LISLIYTIYSLSDSVSYIIIMNDPLDKSVIPLDKRKINTQSDVLTEPESKSINIVDMFRALEKEKKSHITNSPQNSSESPSNPSNPSDPPDPPDPRTMCRLLRINVKNFYDNIYIPFSHFSDDNWDISKVLYKNTDSMYFNETYMTEEDKEKFYNVFDKYVDLVTDIMSPNTKLVTYLKKWTDTTKSKWTSKETSSFLKSMINHKDYYIISPIHIINRFASLNKPSDHGESKDMDLIKQSLETELDNIIAKSQIEIKKFRKIYRDTVTSYVYEHPLNYSFESTYVVGFVNTIILAIIDLAEALIKLNVYAVHAVVVEIVDLYTHLDSVNQFNPMDHDGRNLYIV
jgi:hypothetical protein